MPSRAGHRLVADLPDRRGRPPRPDTAGLARADPGHFDTGGVSNGGTEAINLIIEKTRRLAHGFRTFTHYRLGILLAASGTRPYRRPAHP